jgi:hypothetical protein
MQKYLSDLIKIDIHHVVNSVGYWNRMIGNLYVSLVPELINRRHVLSLFVNHLRQPMTWELSFRYHRGWLQRNGFIPHDCSEVWYVVGATGKRYQFLYVDPETHRIGVRTDFFKGTDAYYAKKQRQKTKASNSKCRKWNKSYSRKKTNFCANMINAKRNRDWECKKMTGNKCRCSPQSLSFTISNSHFKFLQIVSTLL